MRSKIKHAKEQTHKQNLAQRAHTQQSETTDKQATETQKQSETTIAHTLGPNKETNEQTSNKASKQASKQTHSPTKDTTTQTTNTDAQTETINKIVYLFHGYFSFCRLKADSGCDW